MARDVRYGSQADERRHRPGGPLPEVKQTKSAGKRLPLAGALMGELQAFQVRLTARGRDTYAANPGEHDDLVMAVALAVWFGERVVADEHKQ